MLVVVAVVRSGFWGWLVSSVGWLGIGVGIVVVCVVGIVLSGWRVLVLVPPFSVEGESRFCGFVVDARGWWIS